MTEILAVNSDAKGVVCSIRILVGAADKSDDSIQYLDIEQVGCVCRK